MVKTKSKVKVVPVDPKVLEEVLKVVAQVVEPEPQPEEEDTFLLHRDDDEPEPEPEPVHVKPEKLVRPCDRFNTPEWKERDRLFDEKLRAKKAARLESLK